MKFYYAVVIDAEDRQAADQVMRERLDPDEDYGFEYQLWWGPLVRREDLGVS